MSDYSSNDSRITGKFAEHLVLYWLSKKGYECVLADHIGIDIIASKDGERLGIQVKSRSRKENQTGSSYTKFTMPSPRKHIADVRKACEDFGCVACFAFVLDKENVIVGVLIPLENIEKIYNNIGDQSSQDWDIMKFHDDPVSVKFQLDWK